MSYFQPPKIRRVDEPTRYACNGCGDDVDVYEIPVRWIDAKRFRCIPCLDPRHKREPTQLALVEPGRKGPARVEERSYDPAFSEIPY